MKPVTIITGAVGGMGLATAKQLGRDHHVVLSDVVEEKLERAAEALRDQEVEVTPILCDITDRGAVASLFEQAAGLGRIGSVVHAAGVSPQMGAADFIVRINALGTVHITEAALNAATPGFALVNVASVAGHMLPRVALPHRTFKRALSDVEDFGKKLIVASSRLPKAMRAGQAYSLSKAFVIWYSKQMAGRFGEKGARILSVSPGSFDTDMGRLEEKSGSGALLRFAALKRFGTAEEAGGLLAFCAAGEGAGYLTGVDILCDGGTLAGMGPFGMVKLALDRSAPE